MSARPRTFAVLCSAAAALLLPALGSLSVRAAEPAPTPLQLRFFEARVRPVLAERCCGCHGPATQSGGLRLDSRAAILKGGGSGPALVPGEPDKSLLVRAVRYEGRRMPPDGRLKPEEVAALAEWVKLGAPWPAAGDRGRRSRVGETSASRPDRSKRSRAEMRNPFSPAAKAWWAFQPVRRPALPSVSDPRWAKNPIDRFVYQRLRAEGLTPAPEADRRTLIRRVTFDLHGLPPTPEEVEAFVRDPAPGAYERLVDRLLASPRYGERFARQWLDLVRYADSDGYRADEYRPNAWRYRDYVIRAFNEDKPYDRFVQEQLAGDELFPGDPDALVATGYLRHWIYEWNQRDVRSQWSIILNDLTDTTADVFLGLGLQCARCHDHKFDPILQKDYYRLQAFFAPILPRDDLTVATEQQREEYRTRLGAWEAKTAGLRAQIAALEAPVRAKAAEDAITKFPPDIEAMIRKPAARREPLERQLAELAYRQVIYEYDHLETHLKGEAKERWIALRKQLARFDNEKPEPLPVPFAATDVGPRAPVVSIPKKGKEPVEPGFPTVLDPAPARVDPIPGLPDTTGRRAALARRLTRPDNPLTARVIVNRVWQYHFGRGLAANASDFGTLGEPPTHPALLDWLAATFTGVDGERESYLHRSRRREGEKERRRASGRPRLSISYVHRSRRREHPDNHASPSLLPSVSPSAGEDAYGWSLKRLHRLIVTSAAYRQSAANPRATVYRMKDPQNRLYWRGSVHRLDAEEIRDAVLAVTGELDPKAGGPGVPSNEPRRTVYTRVMRNNRDPLLDVFDLPQFFASASSRDTTTTPVQSLLLINSQSMLLRARAFAERVEREAGGEPARLITEAYRLAYGRAPAADETAAALRFLDEQARRVDPAAAGSAEAAFLHEKLPYRDGQAAVLSPEGPQQRFDVPHDARLPAGDFTIEAYVLVRSIYDGAAVRTIAAKWSGSTKEPGWGFGVTGKQSRRKPQTLVLQLIGKKLDGTLGEEAVFSDQRIQLNKPYYVAAAVHLAADGAPGTVTFYVKDLSNGDEPLLTAVVPHRVAGGYANTLPLTIGGNGAGKPSLFDGLIDDVRLSRAALGVEQTLFTSESANRETVGYWQFESKPDVFHDSSGSGLDIRPAAKAAAPVDPRKAALVDFCHVLLNSSEFLYVE